ncbi:PLD nuclease N-terminal domain-containing protein [Stenotrophobium rhamnosiphilum]|uniref:Cardiolipin synthase N-terminal domain-containing protein n=1 Tax=Stenotrophobium rhamnosiphilum TaxID=2029166 RepID=A0A2T5MI73_9GAMM|nr:PLD nuclease N-terminal domain-containing protein [Stenotrophobium rhamnosiphilum]PTU32278.1 hypothetical protein CJD38_06395 [Stenotrophobium rhamnosiphilum]
MSLHVNGFWGIIHLALVIWAVVSIVQSGASTGGKVGWILLIALLPVLGFVIWLFLGPKSR